MELFLITSQEHNELPVAEIESVLKSENIDYNISTKNQPLITVELLKNGFIDSYDKFLNSYKKLADRLAYTHEINELILKTDLNNLEKDFLSIDWEEYIDDSFAIRFKNLNSKSTDSKNIERVLGSLIIENYQNKFKVNLDNPNTLVRLVSIDNIILLGIKKYDINKKHFTKAKPHKRPFFYPGSMSPKLARCMVNLANVTKGDNVLDPFCGTGGILIEAGIIGSNIFGSDLNKKMVFGTKRNLREFNLDDSLINHSNALDLEHEIKMDAVVTDPPYGISSSTGNGKSLEIFKDFLNSISANLKEKGILCMASPHYLDVESIVKDTDLKILKKYSIRMHKSLTRIIYIIEK